MKPPISDGFGKSLFWVLQELGRPMATHGSPMVPHDPPHGFPMAPHEPPWTAHASGVAVHGAFVQEQKPYKALAKSMFRVLQKQRGLKAPHGSPMVPHDPPMDPPWPHMSLPWTSHGSPMPPQEPSWPHMRLPWIYTSTNCMFIIFISKSEIFMESGMPFRTKYLRARLRIAFR